MSNHGVSYLLQGLTTLNFYKYGCRDSSSHVEKSMRVIIVLLRWGLSLLPRHFFVFLNTVVLTILRGCRTPSSIIWSYFTNTTKYRDYKKEGSYQHLTVDDATLYYGTWFKLSSYKLLIILHSQYICIFTAYSVKNGVIGYTIWIVIRERRSVRGRATRGMNNMNVLMSDISEMSQMLWHFLDTPNVE